MSDVCDLAVVVVVAAVVVAVVVVDVADAVCVRGRRRPCAGLRSRCSRILPHGRCPPRKWDLPVCWRKKRMKR